MCNESPDNPRVGCFGKAGKGTMKGFRILFPGRSSWHQAELGPSSVDKQSLSSFFSPCIEHIVSKWNLEGIRPLHGSGLSDIFSRKKKSEVCLNVHVQSLDGLTTRVVRMNVQL